MSHAGRAVALSALSALTALGLVTSGALAKPPPHGAPTAHSQRPAPPLPMLPVIARVRIEAARDQVVVIEEVNLERDAWQSGDLDVYVAFGAPGSPRAFDAHLLAVKEGESLASLDDAGDSIAALAAPRCPVSAQPILGRAQMAGAVLHMEEASLRRAFAASDMATIRTRTLLDLPEEDAQTGRELVVRLGIPGGPPLALRRLELVTTGSRQWVTRAEARLCGPEADAYPLAIQVTPSPTSPQLPRHLPIAPLFSVRHASDDLCVRFWTR